MTLIALGIGIGLLSLIAPGPVNLALLQVSARKGRQPALRGAMGVVGGDSVLGITACALLAFGTALPASVFTGAQLAAALLMVAAGIAIASFPGAVSTSIDRIQSPTRAFFILTSCTPTALGGWLAMLAAMPFAADPKQLALFTVGVLIASSFWHPFLGVTASMLGHRLTDRGQRRFSQLGGWGMAALGAGLAASQLISNA